MKRKKKNIHKRSWQDYARAKDKDQAREAEKTWNAYLTSNPDNEWMASLEFLPPDAQEDLIMAYYFLSFTRIN